MSSKQSKLTELISLAVENGWDCLGIYTSKKAVWAKPHWYVAGGNNPSKDDPILVKGYKESGLMANIKLELFIFSHDFAKAIWGDFKSGKIGNFDELENWKYHLQQAVISKDPLKYYWENKRELGSRN